MTLDYTKMFLIVIEEAVVKGHFAFIGRIWFSSLRKGRYFFAFSKNVPQENVGAHHAPLLENITNLPEDR